MRRVRSEVRFLPVGNQFKPISKERLGRQRGTVDDAVVEPQG